jgi:hypothetical protein
MAKKAKEVEEPSKPKLEFGTPEWMEKREEELDQEMVGHDFAKDIVLKMRWNGDYTFRIFPVADMKDWLRPKGEHWNVFPGPDGKVGLPEGCPQIIRNQYCPVCFAVDKAIAEGITTAKEAYGQGGVGVQRSFYLLILLTEAILEKGAADQPAPPKFTDLPQVKILECPFSVAKKLRQLTANKKIGYNVLANPEDGALVNINKDGSRPGVNRYDVMVLRETMAIPEDFLEYDLDKNEKGEEVRKFIGLREVPDLKTHLPKNTGDELMAKIEKHQHDVPPYIANFTL